MKYEYIEDKLIDKNGNAVMMAWEKPIMKKVSELLCHNKGDVLNIGFGMGIVDNFIREQKPKSHTIIEYHPDVITKMMDQEWNNHATCIFGKWQEKIIDLGVFDGIYLDTWADNRSPDLVTNLIEKHLKVGGIFSVWYNEGEFNTLIKKINGDFEYWFVYIPNENLIPNEQHRNGKFYINPSSENIIIPVIKKIR
jgi:hypothetical protein